MTKARKRRELPPASTAPSPRLQAVDSDTTLNDLDFHLADDIFSSEDWLGILGGVGSVNQTVETFSTLPFLPLGECYL